MKKININKRAALKTLITLMIIGVIILVGYLNIMILKYAFAVVFIALFVFGLYLLFLLGEEEEDSYEAYYEALMSQGSKDKNGNEHIPFPNSDIYE